MTVFIFFTGESKNNLTAYINVLPLFNTSSTKIIVLFINFFSEKSILGLPSQGFSLLSIIFPRFILNSDIFSSFSFRI
jgi:hypothetical protein